MVASLIFRNFGGIFQMDIEKVEDLQEVLKLDDAHWIATSAPINDIHIDQTFLSFLDADHNGRIRTDEIRNAIRWCLRIFADYSDLMAGEPRVNLDTLNGDDLEALALKQAAQRVLTNLGCEQSKTIEPDQLLNRKAILQAGNTNGDGVITPQGVDDEELAQFIRDVMKTVGKVTDISGNDGIDDTLLDSFMNAIRDRLAWQAQAGDQAKSQDSSIMPLGEMTESAYAAFLALRDKLDHYFALVELHRVAPDQFTDQVIPKSLADRKAPLEPEALDAFLQAYPIAPIHQDGDFHFDRTLHPRFVKQVTQFSEAVLIPLFGKHHPTLSQAEWQRIKTFFQPFETWLGQEVGSTVEVLGHEKLSAYASGTCEKRLRSMIELDRNIAGELDLVDKVLQLCLFQQHLVLLLNNFVSFPHLYRSLETALFEMGTLIMDGRRFKLSVRVDDPAKHAEMARNSKIFLIYCELYRAPEDTMIHVATAVTSGGRGNLCVGKRGIFFTTDQRVWDARVVRIIEQPISLWEAMKQPFIRLRNFLSQKIESLSGSGTQQLETALDKRIKKVEKTVQAGIQEAANTDTSTQTTQGQPAPSPSTTPPSEEARGLRDLMMGFSVAGAAIMSSFAYVMKTLSELSLFNIIAAALIAVGLVTIPTMISGAVKLRNRDIAAVLEASGWAINARMRLTRSLSRFFTQQPSLPSTAHLYRNDEMKKRSRDEDASMRYRNEDNN